MGVILNHFIHNLSYVALLEKRFNDYFKLSVVNCTSFGFAIAPILSQCPISIPSGNIQKPLVPDVFKRYKNGTLA